MKKLLLIEDEPILRENTSELLELSNYDVIKAPNGQIGVKLAKKHVPDLIISDIMMPEMDGYDVLQNLANDKRTRDIPFIFLSSMAARAEIRKGMNLGADDYLTKPFEEEELLDAIESRLAKATLLKRIDEKKERDGLPDDDEIRTLHELKNFFDDNGDVVSFKKGDVIFEEGVRSNSIYLLLKGVVKCYKMDEEGKQLTTGLYRADDFLGFTFSIDNIINEETAIAVEDTELAGLTKSDLKTLLEKNHSVSMELMQLLTSNIEEMKKRLLQMAYSSVRKKTAHTLIQFAEIMSKKPEDTIKISRYDLASVAGIATETLIRTLTKFKKEGIIEIDDKRHISILNLKALQQII